MDGIRAGAVLVNSALPSRRERAVDPIPFHVPYRVREFICFNAASAL